MELMTVTVSFGPGTILPRNASDGKAVADGSVADYRDVRYVA